MHLLASGPAEPEVRQYFDGVASLVEPVESHFLWRPRLRDPADEMVLEAAVNGIADAIVTFNLRDYGQIPHQFGIDVLIPKQGISRLTP